jgi:hypothetical protein
MAPVSLIFFQVMAPVGLIVMPMAQSAAILGVNMDNLAVTKVGSSLAEPMNPFLGEATAEAV